MRNTAASALPRLSRAQPDHTEKQMLFNLLDAESHRYSVSTWKFPRCSAASVCGLFLNPDSRYFAVGKLGRDQIPDYHRRKGMNLRGRTLAKSLYLNYDRELPIGRPPRLFY